MMSALRTMAVDLNGRARGKRLPGDAFEMLMQSGARMPLSVLNVDIRGEDIENSPLLFATGDQDGVLRPTERGPVPMPWLETPTQAVPMWMYLEDGAPYAGDPRHALDKVLQRYAAHGWQPVCAVELEFYLIGSRQHIGPEIMSSQALDEFDGFLTELYAGADAMGIQAEAATSEAGIGQFEVTLRHGPAMRMADDSFLFKELLRGLARRHGMTGTFMAKPLADQPGNGLHLHMSVLDGEGQNIFDDGSPEGSENLQTAIGGCIKFLQDSTLAYAPHGDSYNRLVPEAHAPTGVAWGYDNRTVALRVPGGSPQARRLEHRVAGGDVNPYLLLTAVLGAALVGMEEGLVPPPPLEGNAYAADLPQIPTEWRTALARFEGSPLLPRVFPDQLLRNFALTKHQEIRLCESLSEAERHRLYLDTL